MKKQIKQKMLGVFLSLTIFAASVPAAMAENVVELGKPGAPWSTESVFHVVTTEDSYSGIASLNIAGVTGQDNSMTQPVQFEAGSQYTITLYAKNIDNGSLYRPILGDYQSDNLDWYTKEDAGNGWTKYTRTVTPTGTRYFNLQFSDTITTVSRALIDDISVVKVGDETNTNILSNGGFENYTAINDPKPEINVTSENGQLTVSWRNPPVESKGVSLYLGEERVQAETIRWANSENTVTLTGLENGKEYLITVCAEQTVLGDLINRTTAIPKKLEVGKPGAPWSGESPLYVVTTEDSHSGIAALNIAGVTDGQIDLSQSVQYEAGSDYTITMYVKNLESGSFRYKPILGTYQGDNLDWYTTEDAGNGWTKYTRTVTPTGDGIFHLIFDDNVTMVSRVLIDDISIVKVGDETNTNILSNGGFEDYTPIDPKPEFSITHGDGQLTVSWRNPPVESKGVSLYLGEEKVQAETIRWANSENTVILPGLENGKEYLITVCAEQTVLGDLINRTTAIPRKLETGKPGAPWWDAPYIYSVTTQDSYSGVAALSIEGVTNQQNDLLQPVQYEAGSEYTITLYGKNIDAPHLICPILGDYKGDNLDWYTKEDAGNGWTKYTRTVTPEGDSKFHLVYSDNETVLAKYLIDDISIVKVGDETNTNILSNGGFEDYDDFVFDEGVKYGYIEDEWLFWTIDSSVMPSYYKIYKLEGEEKVFVGQTEDASTNYYALDSYTEGDRYIVTSYYSSADVETDGVELKDEVILSGIFGEGSIDDSGIITITKELSSIQSGNIIAGVEIINNTVGTVAPKVYAALYNGSKLVSVQKLETSLEARDYNYGAASVKLAAAVNVPEAGDGDSYSIKVMTWDSEVTPFGQSCELK